MPKELNKSQKEAVEYSDGPLLIVAGAGTGKTTVITQKIAYLIEKGLAKPENILALTFTDKAAEEMQTRVDEMLDIGYADLQISTFHTFCQRLLEQYGLHIGLPNHFKLLTGTDAWLLVRENIYNFNLDYYRPLGNPQKHIHELLNHFSKCKDELISPEEYLEYAENVKLDSDTVEADEKTRLSELANAYHTYNQLLLNHGALDFGDLIYYCVKLLQKRPNILAQLRKRYTHILIDEFQDVNYAQYELVQLLAGDSSQLTVVGDDDQSIYAFRGASVSNILRFKDDFPKAKEVVLNENYRSGQEILDVAYNSIQQNNPDRLEVKLTIDKKLRAMGATMQGVVTHLHKPTLEDEVQSVTQEILRLKEEHKELNWDDFAILVRANSHAEPFLHALEQSGIPYEFLSSSGLYRQSIVIDAFSIFKVITNNYDSLALYRILRMPMFGLSERDIHEFSYKAKKKSLPYYLALKASREFKCDEHVVKAADQLVSLIQEAMKQNRKEKPTSVLLTFLEKSGYIAWLTKSIDEGELHAVRQGFYLKQFFELIDKYQKTVPDAHIAGFVDYFNQVLESGDDGKLYQPEDTPDSVNIMTVHGSKGLEFKHVFIVNCVEERFPTRRKGEGIELQTELIKEQLPSGDYHYQEERRLFYVAATRAKERLYFTSADSYGGTRKKKVSRFLDEIGFNVRTTKENEHTKYEKNLHLSTVPQAHVAKDFQFNIPKTFSFSQIRAFQVCPYQYKMAYLLKIPMAGSPYFSFGNTMHLTLQKFYQRVQEMNAKKQASLFDGPSVPIVEGIKVPALDDLLKLYQETWIDDWYESKRQREGYQEKGREMLKLFYTSHEGNWTVPVTLEGGFKIKLGEYTVTGKIDRIDQKEDGTLQIIDYKTGESKEKIIGTDKEQLLLYQLAAQRLPEYRFMGVPSTLTYYYLNDNTQQSFLGTEKELVKFEEKIVATIQKIHETDFHTITKKDACGRCDFCKMTEFRG